MSLDPAPLTLRKLVWMCDAKRADAWKHTSALMALIANAHRDPRTSGGFEPSDFDPTAPGNNADKTKDYLPVSAAEFGRIIFGKQTHG